ncbi:MAG: DUF6318 family protein [Specibacter sp.]
MRDSHTARNRSTIFTGHRESAVSPPRVLATRSQSGNNRFGRALNFSLRGLAAMAIGGLLVLSACTPAPPGTGVATPPGSTSSTPGATTPGTSTAAPTTVPAYKPATAKGPAQNVPVPVLPAKAKEFSKEGLIAFAEYWYSTLGYVYETGNSAPMMAVTEPDCKTCAFINEPLGAWYDEGGWIVGGLMTVYSSTSTFSESSSGSYQVNLMVQQSQVSSYASDASLNSKRDPSVAQGDIFVATYANGQWTARTAEPLEGG